MKIKGKGGKVNNIKLGSSIYVDIIEHQRVREHQSDYFFLNPSGEPLSR